MPLIELAPHSTGGSAPLALREPFFDLLDDLFDDFFDDFLDDFFDLDLFLSLLLSLLLLLLLSLLLLLLLLLLLDLLRLLFFLLTTLSFLWDSSPLLPAGASAAPAPLLLATSLF